MKEIKKPIETYQDYAKIIAIPVIFSRKATSNKITELVGDWEWLYKNNRLCNLVQNGSRLFLGMAVILIAISLYKNVKFISHSAEKIVNIIVNNKISKKAREPLIALVKRILSLDIVQKINNKLNNLMDLTYRKLSKYNFAPMIEIIKKIAIKVDNVAKKLGLHSPAVQIITLMGCAFFSVIISNIIEHTKNNYDHLKKLKVKLCELETEVKSIERVDSDKAKKKITLKGNQEEEMFKKVDLKELSALKLDDVEFLWNILHSSEPTDIAERGISR